MIWKTALNSQLEKLGHSIRIEELLDTNYQEIRSRRQKFLYCKLSTGFIINELKQYQLFKRRVVLPSDILLNGYSSQNNLDQLKISLKSQAASLGGKKVWSNRSQEERSKIASERAIKCWKEGKWNAPSCKGWNKGLTKETNSSMKKLSEDRIGSLNPMHRNKIQNWDSQRLAEYHQKLSSSMKTAILSGKFTPHIHNSNCNWTATFDQKKYRSSIEAAIALILGENYQFEAMRIQYTTSDGKSHVYITDFYSDVDNMIIEVKHSGKLKENELLKIETGKNFALIHGYEFKILTESTLLDNRELLIANKDRFSDKTWQKIEKYL